MSLAYRELKRIPCQSLADADRKRMARRVLDMIEFHVPPPSIWVAEGTRAICMQWKCPIGMNGAIEIVVPSGKQIQIRYWIPREPNRVEIVRGDFANAVRNGFAKVLFMPPGVDVDEVMQFAEVG